jgi:hypothetical protein
MRSFSFIPNAAVFMTEKNDTSGAKTNSHARKKLLMA